MEEIVYKIAQKNFQLKSDFTYAELEWLDVVYERLTKGSDSDKNKNEISGAFTRDEIEKTVVILLEGKNDNLLTHDDFMTMRESESVKIIADFFLQKALLGAVLKTASLN